MSIIFRLLSMVSRWGPVVFWMAGIFRLSSRPDPLGSFPSPGYGISVGNLAHIAEYAGLSVLLHRALAWKDEGQNVSGSSGSPRAGNPTPTNPITASPHQLTPRPAFITLAITLTYALSDELHQELVSGRSFELADIGYDVAGVVIALGLLWIHRLRQPPDNK